MKITLAGKEYEVRPLTLRQIREIAAATASSLQSDPDPGVNITKIWNRRIDVIAQALQRDNKEITSDVILDMEMPYDELLRAHEEVLKLSGLLPKEPAAPGEAVAEAA